LIELIRFTDKECYATMFNEGLFDKALEKEKEQIIDFAYKILETSDNNQNGYCNVEEFYNQTYNQNK
jgi:hypothetical protein